jgi:hypothetical protein
MPRTRTAGYAPAMEREPEPWQTNAAGPFLSVGDVGVRSLGRDRFLVVTPDGERGVEGFEPARQLARELAGL